MLREQACHSGRKAAAARMREQPVAELDDPPLRVEVVQRRSAEHVSSRGLRHDDRQQAAIRRECGEIRERGQDLIAVELGAGCPPPGAPGRRTQARARRCRPQSAGAGRCRRLAARHEAARARAPARATRERRVALPRAVQVVRDVLLLALPYPSASLGHEARAVRLACGRGRRKAARRCLEVRLSAPRWLAARRESAERIPARSTNERDLKASASRPQALGLHIKPLVGFGGRRDAYRVRAYVLGPRGGDAKQHSAQTAAVAAKTAPTRNAT